MGFRRDLPVRSRSSATELTQKSEPGDKLQRVALHINFDDVDLFFGS